VKNANRVFLIAMLSRVVVLVVFVSSSLLFAASFAAPSNSIPFVNLFSRWDSGWYKNIATNGYPAGHPAGEWAFFPLYPVVIGTIARLFTRFFSFTNALDLAGFLVSNVAFFVSAYFFGKLTKEIFHSSKIAFTATVFFCFWAGAAFYSMLYSESLFMALALISFYYLEEETLDRAVLFGFLASFVRSDGFLVMIPFLVLGVQSYRNRPKMLKLLLSSVLVASPFLLFQLLGFKMVGVFPISLISRNANWGAYPSLSEQFLIYPLQVTNKTGYQILYATGFAFMFLPLAYSLSPGRKTNTLLNTQSTIKYWIFYASTMIIVLTLSYIGSAIRYSVPMLPIYWASAEIYHRNRTIGAVLFGVMTAMLITGCYLLETGGYFL
jgi:Gpi18-like mannosyltransferase